MSTHGIDKGAAAPAADEAGLREQLSALVDGTLDPARARFLLRRLQHDPELAGCFERWQLAGDALRGAGPLALPAGFGPRVAGAIAAETVPAASAVPQGVRRPWALGALAASVAVVALFVARPVFEGEAPAPDGPAVATLPEIEVPFAPAIGAMATAEAPDDRLVQAGVEATAAREASVAASDAGAGDTVLAVAEPAATPLPAEAADPFRSLVPPQSRPWPRAVLPGVAGRAADVFTVDYGGRVSAPQASGPFAAPATVPPAPATTADGDDAVRDDAGIRPRD
jgi:negative regulator of sigma E activity